MNYQDTTHQDSTPGKNAVTEPLDGQVLAEAIQRTRPAVVNALGDQRREGDMEDVLQATWESAWRARGSFDPAKGSSLHAWVVVIAKRRAIDVLRSRSRDLDVQHRAEQESTSRVASMLSITQDDHAEETMMSLETRQTLIDILSVVNQVIINRESTARGLSLLMVFGDDVELASRALGVSMDRLRQARRELVRCCQVVVKAQEAVRQDRPATMRHLIECLPQGEESGNWAGQIGLLVARAGGQLGNVTPADVMAMTGFSFNTARQYLAQTQHLLRVAATVFNHQKTTAQTADGKKP